MIKQDESVILASNMIKDYAFNQNDSLNILRVMDTCASKEIVCKVIFDSEEGAIRWHLLPPLFLLNSENQKDLGLWSSPCFGIPPKEIVCEIWMQMQA
jgi:hypothetical protein